MDHWVGLHNIAFNNETAKCTHALVTSQDIQCQVRQINSTHNVTNILQLDTKGKLTQFSIVHRQEQSVQYYIFYSKGSASVDVRKQLFAM